MTQIVDLLKDHGILQDSPMKCLNAAAIGALTCALSLAPPARGQPQPTAAERRDGQHDFDFDIGVWKTNLAELEIDAASGHLQVLSLRLYDPRARQWSLNTANANSGSLGVPTVGEFRNGRGEFFDQESINGRTVLVRNVWSDISADSCRFEQAFSNDGGKTWEVNWIALDTRVK
jgi:hypothetical protein